MKPVTTGLVCAALIFSLFAAACAKPPTAEMNNAIEAVTRAENDADAALYAGNTLARARDALARMKAEAASKRYDAAKNYAADAVSAADKAIADGRAGAARAREEASVLVSGLAPAIAETGQGINSASAAKLPLDFDAIGREFETARTDADQAQAALSGSRYQDAMDRGRSARAGLSDINQKLAAAAMAVSRKK